jgi:poly-beta-1,6-N-acetyl-D-glucosamine synthase
MENHFRPVVVIPVLNEEQHLSKVVTSLMTTHPDIHVVIVDGGSTDGTPEIINALTKRYSSIMTLSCVDEDSWGFGVALRMGLSHAVAQKYDPIITMDGDESHDPVYLKNFFDLYDQYSIIINSRYVNGIRVEGWRFRKMLLSKFANMYVSFWLVRPIWDFTSGFRCYRRDFLEKIDLNALFPQGYIVQIQLLHLGYKLRQRIIEVPFIYRETNDGKSRIPWKERMYTFFKVISFSAPVTELFRYLIDMTKEYEHFVEEYDEMLCPPKLKNDGRFVIKNNYSVSIGVIAYNEETIIGACLDSLIKQNVTSGWIKEIIVVSSGSTDKTDAIVREYTEKDSRVQLLQQPERKGKSTAINEFLTIADSDLIVIESADTIAGSTTIEELVKPFSDEQVGMVGGHAVPVNSKKGFVGYCVHTLWELHHQISLINPKCGEMIAFRNLISKIPKYTAVDEAAIENLISQIGLKLAYAPEAIVKNKGPETIRDFIRQRKRIALGHNHLYVTTGHRCSTSSGKKILKIFFRRRWSLRDIFFFPCLISIEIYSRFFGAVDFYIRDKNPFIWDIAKTTKRM